MTGGDPNKAEIEIDISGDAVEQAKALAKALDDAADAEERLQKAAERANRVTSSLARQRAQEIDRQRKRDEREQVESERRRQRVTSGLARQRVQEESRLRREWDQAQKRRDREAEVRESRLQTSPEVEARRRFSQMKREEMVRARLDAMSGKGGANARPGGLAGLAHAAESRFGLPAGTIGARMGGMVGPAAGMAAMATAAKFGVDTMTTVNDQMQYGSPYADAFTTERNIFGNLPFSKEFYAGKDLLTGRAQGIERVNKTRMEEEARAPVRWEAMQRQAELERERRTAALNARSVRANPLPDAPGGERRTLSQQQGYQLAQRLLPLQEQLAEASTSRAEAENAVTAAQERQKKMAEERQRVQDRIDRTRAGSERLAKAGLLSSGDPEYLRRLNSVTADTKRLEDFDRQEVVGRTEIRQREEAAAAARRNAAEAGSRLSAGRLADLQHREQVAGSQAERLTLMGAEGRLRGQLAMMAAKTYGIGMLSQDMIGSARAYGGEEFMAMAREEGERRYVSEARPYAPQEYRDTGRDIRNQVDVAARQLQQQRQADREAGADDLLKVAETGGDAAGERIADAIERAMTRLAETVVNRLQYQGTEQGYRQPRG